jgi:mono/diheme cytochrome c family protein
MTKARHFSESLYMWVPSSFFITAVIVIIFAAHQGHAITSQRAAKASEGDAIFHKRCAGCHNKQPGDTTPFGPPNLHGLFAPKPVITAKDAVAIIREGKGTMPAFGRDLSSVQIEALIRYLKTQ